MDGKNKYWQRVRTNDRLSYLFLMVSLLLVFMTSCASMHPLHFKAFLASADANKASKELTPADNEMLLYLIRPEEFYGTVRGMVVLVDGKVKAVLGTGNYFAVTLPQGKHRIDAVETDGYALMLTKGKPMNRYCTRQGHVILEMVNPSKAVISFWSELLKIRILRVVNGVWTIENARDPYLAVLESEDKIVGIGVLSRSYNKLLTDQTLEGEVNVCGTILEIDTKSKSFSNASLYADGFDIETMPGQTVYVQLKEHSWKMPYGGITYQYAKEPKARKMIDKFSLTLALNDEDWYLLPTPPYSREGLKE